MTKSETYINFIIDQLRNGNISHNEVMTVFVSKWQLSERQFTRYWNTANERYTSELQTVNDAKQAIHTKAELTATKANVLSKIQAKEILSQIAKKEQSKPSEKIQAIKALSDLEGWNDQKAGITNIIRVNPVTVEIPEDIPD